MQLGMHMSVLGQLGLARLTDSLAAATLGTIAPAGQAGRSVKFA